MRKIIVALFTIISFSSVFAQNDKRLKGLEKELNTILEVTKAPGFAVAIVEGKKIIYAKGFGYSDFENKIPADANTLYAIGSSSKAFTSAILGQLRQDDKMSFEESPTKYLPNLKFNTDDMNTNIIIKDLMSHRTGLPRNDYSWYLFPTNNKDSLLLRVKHQEPFTGVRKQWYYNNFMFLAQGVIAEKITGKSWEENIKERFFKPLDMNRSNVSIDELKKSLNAALGYELVKDSLISKMDYYHIAGMSPAGSINSSVNDMSNWLITWINNGKFNEQQVIPESYINEATSSQMVASSGQPDKEFPDMHLSNYGYAWFLSSYKGHYRVEHGGNIDGFSANVAFFPTDSLGIVVLANQNGSAVPSLVRNIVADRMLKTQKTNWSKKFTDQKLKEKKEEKAAKDKTLASKVENTKPSHVLQDFTGKYSNLGYGEFTITNQNDSLFASFTLKKFYLKHVHYDVFEIFEVTKKGIDTTEDGAWRLNFNTNDVGDISLVKMKMEEALEHPIEFKHKPSIINVDKAILEKYVGSYELAGIEIKVYLKNESTLYLFVKGQPEYELLATDKHKFTFKTLEGFKVEFVASDDASINAILMIQPNGTYKATRK
ncbi:serine hydrolase [Polaribacter glomeratus]|uniref:Penicillin-binding protein n=1 Tax=Polaribacter glomeratus TaxID=102 RepID=A0A2S7WXE5_9FLAO|nr:serine hydrolase [Polaribacter glomeratus]PQJ82270.1 penicillin-binding protein [Polaribacter glomeratus]TXD66865.1 serine hydrolase [Polaribacter glomeratus]